jgi:hypothetical protein
LVSAPGATGTETPSFDPVAADEHERAARRAVIVQVAHQLDAIRRQQQALVDHHDRRRLGEMLDEAADDREAIQPARPPGGCFEQGGDEPRRRAGRDETHSSGTWGTASASSTAKVLPRPASPRSTAIASASTASATAR